MRLFARLVVFDFRMKW